jgi:glutathione S-transferase
MQHAVYGDPASRDSIALVTALAAKRIDFEFVPQTPALSLSLAVRAGREEGPYLRTPEGLVMGDLATTLDYLERIQPEPAWRPTSPVRRICARLLEDWIELWLPIWPERAPAVLEGLSVHLAASGFLLGPTPCRPDGSLAAWLEADALADPDVRDHVAKYAPQLLHHAEAVRRTRPKPVADDAIPISLLPVLAELARDYHAYLEANRVALFEGDDRVVIDLGFGRTVLPAWSTCEERRAAIGREVSALSPAGRRAVRQMLEPLGAWHALTLPPVAGELAAGDPRSL